MTRSMLASLVFVGGLALITACQRERPNDEPAPTAFWAPTSSRPVCEVDLWISCPAAFVEGGPPRDNALVWANVDGTAIAVYADGTMQRTANVRSLLTPKPKPDEFIIANVGASRLARIREDIAALRTDDLQRLGRDPDSFLIVPEGRSCFVTKGTPTCVTGALVQFQDDLRSLARAADDAWRASTSGTVWLLSELPFAGPWPLAPELAADGVLTLRDEEARLLIDGSIYRITDDTFMRIDSSLGIGDLTYVHASRVTSVLLSDDIADLRAQLIASVGHDGIPLGSDRFPTFKRHEIAILPPHASTPETFHGLTTLEHLDLRPSAPLD